MARTCWRGSCYTILKETHTDEGGAAQSSVKNVFIRGSVVRYVHLPAAAVDTPLLEDATRRGSYARVIELAVCIFAVLRFLTLATEASQTAAKAKQGT